jgi:hypothetical protein
MQTLSDRVNGDLVAAILRAREIDERLDHFKHAGGGHRKVGHDVLVERFVDDLQKRADAGEIAPATARRYASALGHYLAFANQISITRSFPFAGSINREFALAFAAYLAQLEVHPNGHRHSARRLLRARQFVLDAARTLFDWAADPDRGNLLPTGFRNPFVRMRQPRTVPADQFGEPDVTVEMAVEFIRRCDAFQLPLFGLMIMCGLRAAEPTLIFREHIDDHWLRVKCLPALAYTTKGRRDKRFPLASPIAELITPMLLDRRQGLLFIRRGIAGPNEVHPMVGASLEATTIAFNDRCALERVAAAAHREKVRNRILRLAGGLTYDAIDAEFQSVRRDLHWPAQATLKDFRHLFSTCLQNAGTPEFYRRYLMGQSPGKAAIVTYSHLNELRKRYEEAVHREMRPLADAILIRVRELGLP